MDTNPQAKQRAAEKRRASAVAKPVALRKPRIVTRMKDMKRLESLLAAPGRHLTATDRMLVLSSKEATITFEPDAEGAIVATLVAGDGRGAAQVVKDVQARYVEGVRVATAQQVKAAAPSAGWKVAAQQVARDGSIAITLQKARPRNAVSIG